MMSYVTSDEVHTPRSETSHQAFSYHNHGSSWTQEEQCQQESGFCKKEHATLEEEMKMLEVSPSSHKEGGQMNSFSKRNNGFLSFGSWKLYTEDINSSDDGSENFHGNDDDDDDHSLSGDSDLLNYGSSVADANSSDEPSGDSESDIDEEVAEDYLKGTGGQLEDLKMKRFVEWDLSEILEAYGEDIPSTTRAGDEFEVLSGIALAHASSEFGMKKPRSGKCHHGLRAQKPSEIRNVASDRYVAKCPLTPPREKKIAPHSYSWPRYVRRKNYKYFPGEKKKHRKENIAAKRQARMSRAGLALEQINSKLMQMVLSETDILSFEPMHSRSCSQVQRLASVYHLKTNFCGSGKKRFMTVMRTWRTCMPSASDRPRIEKLLGTHDDNRGAENKRNTLSRMKCGSNVSSSKIMSASKGEMQSAAGGMKTISRRKKGCNDGVPYANQPVTFISSGIMQVDTIEAAVDDHEKTLITKSARLGAFEEHTKGFGSRIMAKMGFVEGRGLGRDRQGMVEPIEATMRPRSLGLGNHFAMINAVKANGGSINKSRIGGNFALATSQD